MSGGGVASLGMVVVGAGILGLSVAELASRAGETVVVVEAPGNPGASYAAAAQLGLKGQGVAKAEEFRLKLAGQRIYEEWIANWNLLPEEAAAVAQWFRRGVGRDHVLSDSEFAEQKRRLEKHEPEVWPPFVGPSLVVPQSDGTALRYLCEVSLDARKMLAVLRCVLQRRGVRFVLMDAASRDAMDALVCDMQARDRAPVGVIVCAGAQTFAILKSWQIEEASLTSRLIPESKRLSLGATVVFERDALSTASNAQTRAKLDFDAHVIEGFLDRSQSEIVALTSFANKVFVTSLSVPGHCSADPLQTARQLHGLQEDGQGELQESFAEQCKRLEKLFEKHRMNLKLQAASAHGGKTRLGLDSQGAELSFQLRVGLRMRATRGDVVLERVPESGIAGASHLIVFAGANRSGFLYGPALARQVLALHCGSS